MNTNISGPLVSLIVSVYNVKDYLKTCLQSILGQTYENLEVILVDDGSDDGSFGICDEYARMDQRVKTIHLPHGEVNTTRNVGSATATGELLGFVGSDDRIDHDMYQYSYTLMQEYDADVSAYTYLLEQEGGPSRIISNTGKLYVPFRKEIIRVLIKNDLVKDYLWAKFFKRKLFDRLSFPVGRVYENVVVLYKILYSSQKVTLSYVSKYHHMIRKNKSIVRGGYDLVKEYHYFPSLYGQGKFIQNAKLGSESSIGVFKGGIHSINHTSLCLPSPAFEDIIDETMSRMHEYCHIIP